MNGPVKVYTAFFRILIQFLYAFGLGLGVRHAPAVAVVGVVFRSVNVYIHFVTAVKIELAQACAVAPRRSVETFHHSTEFYVGPVSDGACFETPFLRHGQQRLYAVEESLFIGSGNDGAFLAYLEIVAFGLWRDFFCVCLYGLITFHAKRHCESCLRRCFRRILSPQCLGGNRLGPCFVAPDAPGLRGIEQVSATGLHLLWHRIDIGYLGLASGCGTCQKQPGG